jgi:xanthine dehydrogenase accessory factor
MRLDHLRALNEARAAREPIILVTDTAGGEQRIVRGDAIAADPMGETLEKALRSGKSGTVEHGGKEFFLTVQAPPVRIIVIGAVHISQAMAPIAKLTGFDMTIVDPRTAFATPERFPDVKVIAEWPDVALPPLKLDRYTAVGLFTHDPKIDDPGLVQALQADCFYIGALGSRKAHARRLERMKAAGFADEQLARIHAPVGLDIGSVTPAEIAVAVIGEIILSLRKKPLRSQTAQIETGSRAA